MTCGAGEPGHDMVSTAVFAEKLFEFVYLRAGTGKLWAGDELGKQIVRIDDKLFIGDGWDEVFEKVFKWLVDKEVTYSEEEVDKWVAHADEAQVLTDEEVIDAIVGSLEGD